MNIGEIGPREIIEIVQRDVLGDSHDDIVAATVVRVTKEGDAIVRLLFDPYDDGERVYFNQYRISSNGNGTFHKAGF